MMQEKHIPNPKGGPNLIRNLEIENIKIPELRVTSTMDDHILAELRESIQKDGILQPLQVIKIGEDLFVVDGLHRMVVARELGIDKVPCLIQEGTERELFVKNLVLNRQRGKSNPVHEAEVIRHLLEEEKLTLEEVSALCNLSPGWVSRLHKVSHLPPQVLSLVEEGALAVSSADHLTRLQDPEVQIQVARDAVTWRYTEDQVKTRVADLLQTRPEPGPGDTAFESGGRPTIIPLVCYFCHKELPPGAGYIWICDGDLKLINDFWSAFIAQQPAPPAEPIPAQPGNMVLTAEGWKPGPGSAG